MIPSMANLLPDDQKYLKPSSGPRKKHMLQQELQSHE